MAQNTARNNSDALVPLPTVASDHLAWWIEQYFQHAVTTSPASQRVQRRDLGLFLRYLQAEEGTDQRLAWTPRLARAFQQHLRQTLTPEGRRADRKIKSPFASVGAGASAPLTGRPGTLDTMKED